MKLNNSSVAENRSCLLCCHREQREQLPHLRLWKELCDKGEGMLMALLPPGRGLPLLPSRQHLHVPGARVCAQRRSSALPLPSAGRLQRPADKGAPAAGHAEPQVLRAGPGSCLQEGSAGTAHQPAKRYLRAAPHPLSLGAQSPQDSPQTRGQLGFRMGVGAERHARVSTPRPFLRILSTESCLAPTTQWHHFKGNTPNKELTEQLKICR